MIEASVFMEEIYGCKKDGQYGVNSRNDTSSYPEISVLPFLVLFYHIFYMLFHVELECFGCARLNSHLRLRPSIAERLWQGRRAADDLFSPGAVLAS